MLTSKDVEILDKLLDRKLNKLLDKKLRPIIERLDKIESRLIKLEHEVKTITNFLDKEIVNIKKRVSKIETHLDI